MSVNEVLRGAVAFLPDLRHVTGHIVVLVAVTFEL